MPADRQEFAVAVDFGQGEVTGFSDLSGALVEFIQEDRVTADDDLAMVMAEMLATYLDTGEVTQPQVSRLMETLLLWQGTPAFSDWAIVKR